MGCQNGPSPSSQRLSTNSSALAFMQSSPRHRRRRRPRRGPRSRRASCPAGRRRCPARSRRIRPRNSRRSCRDWRRRRRRRHLRGSTASGPEPQGRAGEELEAGRAAERRRIRRARRRQVRGRARVRRSRRRGCPGKRRPPASGPPRPGNGQHRAGPDRGARERRRRLPMRSWRRARALDHGSRRRRPAGDLGRRDAAQDGDQGGERSWRRPCARAAVSPASVAVVASIVSDGTPMRASAAP